MTFSVTVLGSSAMFATVERACAGYLVEIDGTRLWMDAGAGTWRNLLRHIDYRDIDGVLLSHRHPDHTSDVMQAYHARQYGGVEPMKAIPLWAPSETLERLAGWCGEYREAFELKELSERSTIDIGGARLTFARMAHPPETLGVRIEHSGNVLAYTADSGPDADFRALAGNARFFLCEATFQSEDPPWHGHMHAAEAGRIAHDCDVGTLVLTHLPPGRDHRRSQSEALKKSGAIPVVLAHDHLVLRLDQHVEPGLSKEGDT